MRRRALKLLPFPDRASGFFLTTWQIDLFIELLRTQLSTNLYTPTGARKFPEATNPPGECFRVLRNYLAGLKARATALSISMPTFFFTLRSPFLKARFWPTKLDSLNVPKVLRCTFQNTLWTNSKAKSSMREHRAIVCGT